MKRPPIFARKGKEVKQISPYVLRAVRFPVHVALFTSFTLPSRCISSWLVPRIFRPFAWKKCRTAPAQSQTAFLTLVHDKKKLQLSPTLLAFPDDEDPRLQNLMRLSFR